jgi:microcystin-dependent protein
MAEPFLSEIRLFSFVFAPRGWALCNGQLMPINQNQPLFSLLGTTFGGNGQTNFALPNLQGRVPIHAAGNAHPLGQQGGEAAHTITAQELPAHTHQLRATSGTAGQSAIATGKLLGPGNNLYAASGTLTTLNASSVGNVGGSQAHENRQPYLVLNFCIALQGIFPSPN